MTSSRPLSAAAQAAYAEIVEVTRVRDLQRTVKDLSGSFSRKTVRGAVYWYYQFTDPALGRVRQVFVGPDNPSVRALVDKSRRDPGASIDASTKAAIALGCAPATISHFRIIRRLSEVGFFHAGGVLVGTHALLAMGNALGVTWGGTIASTQDIDFAHAGHDIELALPNNLTIKTRDAVESLEAGFLPVPGFQPWDKSATFVSKADKHLRVDFLTPMVGGKEAVFEHRELGVPLQPLRFMEFVLEDIQQACIINAAGAVLVNIPDPARFALHKLLVFVERRKHTPEKARKDLKQAVALIEVLTTFRRDDLLALWDDLLARGPGWRERAQRAVTALGAEAPELRLLSNLKERLPRKAPRKVSPPTSRRKRR